MVWKFLETDESSMSTTLPVENVSDARKQPWLLHSLYVNTLNFCSFTTCIARPAIEDGAVLRNGDGGAEEELLIAVPNILSSETVTLSPLLPLS